MGQCRAGDQSLVDASRGRSNISFMLGVTPAFARLHSQSTLTLTGTLSECWPALSFSHIYVPYCTAKTLENWAAYFRGLQLTLKGAVL